MDAAAARLVCPLCETVVVDGAPPRPGSCPGCGARIEGDAESAPEAVAAALAALGVDGALADPLAHALFTVPPERGRRLGLAITSDARAGFYRWWVFLGPGGDPAALARRVIEEATALRSREN